MEIAEYLSAVKEQTLPVNHQVIYHLQEIIGLLPELGGDVDLGKAFRVGVNDSTMVVYLSALIRTVLALHDLSESTSPRFLLGVYVTSSTLHTSNRSPPIGFSLAVRTRV